MKILDVDLLQDGLQRNIAMLERLQNEVGNIQDIVKELVAMEEVLKGAGGSAIRGFYSDVHLPFLHFFLVFSDNFKQKLQQVEAALISLEPDTAGYILEQFLEGELEQGLTLIANITERLTNEANSIMDSVSDIVALPHLNDSEVQEGVQNSKKKRDDTVLQLHEFDASQTTSLNPVEQNVQTMGSWLADMEGMFKAGVKDIHFQPSQWNALTFGSGIRTELFPKVYLNPNSLWVEEHEKMIGTMISTETFQALELKRMNTIEENVGENVKYHQYANGILIKEYNKNGTVFYEIVSKVEYKEEVVQIEKPKENKLLDGIQFGLDLVGLIPGIGEIADGANGIIYTARGDKLNATLSFGAMIPFAGWGSTGAKFVNKGSQLYQARNVLSNEKVASMFTPTYQEVVNGPLSRTQSNMYLFKTDFNNMTPKSVTYSNPLTSNLPLTKPDVPTTSKSLEGNGNTDIKNVDVTTKVTGKPTKSETLAKNREKGKAFEQAQLLEFEKIADNVVEQVTIKTNQGTRIRVDAIGTDKTIGNIVIQEYKSSTTAPLTKNQIKGFPELQSGGGNVVGKGKGKFEGGTQIPPTKVEIIRPE